MTDIRQHIAEQLVAYHSLGALKAAIQDWLASDGSFDAFDAALEAHHAQPDSYQWGEIDDRQEFVLLSEQQMVQKSLEALEQHRRTGIGFTHEQVEEWAVRLGTERESACP
jgi:hypothetical protein